MIVGFAILLGAQIRTQTANLVEGFPQLLAEVGARLGAPDLYERVLRQARQWIERSGSVENIFGLTFGLFGVVANLVVVAAAGFYLAARPQDYTTGLLKLFPRRGRPKVAVAMREAGRALKLWLVGQLIAMVLVGTLIALGLTVIGVPSALALGFIAGLAEFVPMVGPFVAAIPALLVAMAEGGSTVLWAAALFLAVQQVEGNLITPLVQRRTVDLPPVLALFAVIGVGALFGPLGVILATPLAVVLLVLVKQLYIRDTLHESTRVPGEQGSIKP